MVIAACFAAMAQCLARLFSLINLVVNNLANYHSEKLTPTLKLDRAFW